MSLITFVLFLEYFHFQHLEIARLWRGGYYLETITHSFILGLGFILGGTSGTTYPSIEFVIKKIIIKTVFADNRSTEEYSGKLSGACIQLVIFIVKPQYLKQVDKGISIEC